jgi:hypothetical protein
VIRQRVKQAIFEIAILSILIDYCQLPNVMSEFRTSYIIITNILLSRIYYYHEYVSRQFLLFSDSGVSGQRSSSLLPLMSSPRVCPSWRAVALLIWRWAWVEGAEEVRWHTMHTHTIPVLCRCGYSTLKQPHITHND